MNISTDEETRSATRELDHANFTVASAQAQRAHEARTSACIAAEQPGRHLGIQPRASAWTAASCSVQHVTMTGAVAKTTSLAGHQRRGHVAAVVADFLAGRAIGSTTARQYSTSAKTSTRRWATSRASTSARQERRPHGRRGREWGGIRQLIFNGNARLLRESRRRASNRGRRNVRRQHLRARTRRASTSATTREYDKLDGAIRDRRDHPAGRHLRVARPTSATIRIGPGASMDRTAPMSAATTTAIGSRSAPAAPSRSARRCSSSRTTRTTASRSRAAPPTRATS